MEMMEPIIGMDFGTTNSGMAVFDGRRVDVLPLDPTAPNPRVARTALYITNEQSVTIGRAAVDLYFAHNIGRPSKMQKVWIGELEVIADRVYYVTDVYSLVDVLSPGRLFLSIKTGLRDEHYAGTVVGQYFYALEDLIALYLSVTRARAERLLDHELAQVVLGRPVHFARDPEHDRLAEARLLQAAFRAGYETVYLQYEPVAAAYSYELTLDRPENVLVFDFGGGTLDITIMRLGERPRHVLATGGIPVAGDVFDQKLVRAKLPRHFGEGSFYGSRHKALTIPAWIYDAFSDWQTIMELQAPDNRHILREIAQTAQRRYQIEALLALVEGNYGLRMFDLVENAKRTLSEKRGAEIRLEGPGFDVREFVTRGEFEGIIRAEILAIEQHLDETVRASGLRPEQIDAVIRTGGSAQIPAFQEMLARRFGAEKVRGIDVFSSVTAGLGIAAREVQNGESELAGRTQAEFAGLSATGGKPSVSPVNLSLLQKRIRLEEKGETVDRGVPATAVILLGFPDPAAETPGNLAASILPAADLPDERDLSGLGWDEATAQALIAAPDDVLLILTSRYRFLLVTARQLADLQTLHLGLGDLHRLAPRETLCAVGNWSAIRARRRLLLATSFGFVRAYPLDALRAAVEAPTPLQLDNPPPGAPIAVFGVEMTEEVAVVTQSGRGARWPLRKLPLTGLQLINCGRGESFDRATTALPADPEAEAVLALADGYGRRLRIAWIPAPDRPNSKGKSLIARRSPVVGLAALPQNRRLYAVTTQRLLALSAGDRTSEDSTKTYPLVRLSEGETLAGWLTGGE